MNNFNKCSEKERAFIFELLFPTGQNANVMAGAQAAILDHEMEITCFVV